MRPRIQRRNVDISFEEEAKAAGVSPLLARILAARPRPADVNLDALLMPRLLHLTSPFLMADMQKAATRVAEAIMNGECIGIETDHDCDGQTSHAVLFEALTRHFKHPAKLVRSYIGHRLNEGYGLSESVANRILNDDPRPQLLLTADNGSTDEPRIAKLNEAGIDVIVTDHHAIPAEGIPKSAYACLNPTRKDCTYPDPYIAGCMVAWLLMAATRQILIEKNDLPKDAPHLADILDFVAVGTVADCVSMAQSQNNRAVVRFGLRLIAQHQRPCWRALKNIVGPTPTAEDLGFTVGPLLNSDGRLGSAFGSVHFLLAQSDREALEWVEELKIQNEERKQIQRDITGQGLKIAREQVHAGRYSLVVFLPEGHAGVHGISASKIKEKLGRPTVFLAPKMNVEHVLTGSVRGIDGFHVRDAMAYIAERAPHILLSFGGHRGAGGLSLHQDNLSEFEQLFEEATRQQLSEAQVGPVIWTDGPISPAMLNLECVDELKQLEPFGREFEAPLFEMRARVMSLRVVGKDGTHAQVELQCENQTVKAIWFQMRESETHPLPVEVGQEVDVILSLRDKEFRGERSLNPQVVDVR